MLLNCRCRAGVSDLILTCVHYVHHISLPLLCSLEIPRGPFEEQLLPVSAGTWGNGGMGEWGNGVGTQMVAVTLPRCQSCFNVTNIFNVCESATIFMLCWFGVTRLKDKKTQNPSTISDQNNEVRGVFFFFFYGRPMLESNVPWAWLYVWVN